MDERIRTGLKELRSFGLLVGGIFILLALLPLIKGHSISLWPIALGLPLATLAIIYPQSLKWPRRGWMMIGEALGYVNLRIILGIVFFIFITPLAIIKRIFGGDSMGLKFNSTFESYATPSKKRKPEHIKYQF